MKTWDDLKTAIRTAPSEQFTASSDSDLYAWMTFGERGDITREQALIGAVFSYRETNARLYKFALDAIRTRPAPIYLLGTNLPVVSE